MSDRPRFFDDLAGVAGGAISALTGLREEAEAMLRARMDELIQRLDLVRREELDVVREMAANARAGQETAESASATLTMRVTALEARVAGLEAGKPDHPGDDVRGDDVSGKDVRGDDVPETKRDGS